MSFLTHHRLFFRCVSLFTIISFLPSSVQAWHFLPPAQVVVMAASDGPAPLPAEKLEQLAANTDGGSLPLLSDDRRERLAQGQGVVGNLTLGITPDRNTPSLKTLTREELQQATAGPRVVEDNPYDAGLPEASTIIATLDAALEREKNKSTEARIKVAQAGGEPDLSPGAEAAAKLLDADAKRDNGDYADATMDYIRVMNDYPADPLAVKAADRGIVRMVKDIKAGLRTPEEISAFEQQLESYTPTTVQGGYGVLTYLGRRSEDEYNNQSNREIVEGYARKAVASARDTMQLDPHHPKQLGVIDEYLVCAKRLPVIERDVAIQDLKVLAETMPASIGRLSAWFALANFEGDYRNNRGLSAVYRANLLADAGTESVEQIFEDPDVEPWLKGMIGHAIGGAHWSLGNYDDAIAFYEATLPHMSDAGSTRALVELSLAEAKAEKYRNNPVLAADQYNNYLTRFPPTPHAPKAILQLASVFMTAGDYQGAADLYSEVTLRWPESRYALQAQADLEYIFANLYESTPVAGLLPPTEEEQALAMRCGPEALARLLETTGLELDIDELAQLAGTDATGTSMAGLVKAAQAKGITLTGVQANGIDELKPPYIAYVNGDHFVLVTETTDDNVTVVDSTQGERGLSRGEFAAIWNGMSLVLGTEEDVIEPMTVAALKATRGGTGSNPSGDKDPDCDPDDKDTCPPCDNDRCQGSSCGGGPPQGPTPPTPPKGPTDYPTIVAPQCPTSGVPVNSPGITATVNVFETALKLHEQDLSLGVTGGLRMSFARHYINERGWHRGEYQGTTKPWMNNVGDGWTHNLNTHIRTQSGTTPSYVTLYDSTGSARTYEYDSTSGGYDWYYRHADGQSSEKRNVLKRDTTTLAYTWERNNDLVYEFSAATTDSYRYARLESIEGQNGDAITLNYDGAVGTGKLTKAASPTSDYTLNMSYSGSLITKVELKKSTAVLNSVQYAYASNELTKVTDHASKTVIYSYDTHVVEDKHDEYYYGRYIDNITDKSGTDVVIDWTWNTSGSGQATKIEITNVEGLKASYDRGAGNVVTIKELDGTTQLSKYVNTPLSTSDVSRSKYHDYYKNTTNYERWEFQYDSNNMMTKLVAPDSSAYATVGYNSVGRITTMQYGTGPVTTYYYDNGGDRLTRVADAAGIGNTWHYDANDRLTKVTHPSLATAGMQYAYDANGYLTRTTSPTGVYTDFEYDATGRETKTIQDAGGLDIEVVTYYDDLGNVTRMTDPRGKDTYYYFGDVSCGGCGGGGQMTKVVDALSNETKWEYDSDGLMTKTIDKANVATSYEYDSMRRITKTVFPSGGSVNATVAYNLLGQVTSHTGFGGNTTTLAYDHMGRQTTVTDPVGDIDYSFDSLGRLSTVTDSLNHTTTNEYDGASRLTKVTDAIGKSTVYAFDSYGRRTKVGAGSSGIIDPTTYFYDNTTGMLTRVEYSSSSYTATYHYDGEARQTKLTDWLDATNGLRYAYDDVGRVTQLTDYDNSTLTYTYDDDDNVLTMVDYHGNTTSYTYNDLGQLSTLTAPGSKIWTCEYDGYSRLTKVDMPNGMHTEYGFDTDGRATKTHHKDGSTVKQGFDYAFDDGGNITKITHENSAYWAYEYDGRERLTKAERYDGTPSLLHRYTYTYDDGDNILTKAIYDAGMATTDTTTFTYNNANEQTSMVNGATTTNMAYDAWGQLTSRTRGTYLASYVYRYGGKLYSVTSDYPGEDDVTYETGGDQKRRSRVSGLDETWYNWSMKWVVVSEEDNADGSSGSLARTYVGRNTAHVDGTAPSTGTWKYYTTERLNSTSGVWNQDKTTFAEFDYTPFGDLYTSTGSVGNVSHRFTGHDWDDANELYFAPYRYYSATLLRWVKKDPAGMIDGPNMFTYAKNRPILYSDRLGLKIPFLPGKIKVGKNCKRKYLDDFSHKPEDGGDLEDLPDPGDTTPTDGFYGPTGRFKIPDGTTCTVKCNKKGKPVSVKCCNKVPGFVPTKIPDDDPYFPDNPHGPNDIPPLTGPILPPTGPGPPYIPPFKL